MRPTPRTFLAALALLLAGTGCASGPQEAAPRPSSTATPSTSFTASPTPRLLPRLKGPDFRLHLGSGDVDLHAWTACYGKGCYDGMPTKPFVDAGSTDAVEFKLAHKGWSFETTFTESAGKCPHRITTKATRVSPTRFRIDPAGNAGSWDVDIFGRGPEGDAVTTFRWNTEKAGFFPPAVNTNLSVLADQDGKISTYGVEFNLNDLAATPRVASAVVTVVAADGDRSKIRLGRPDKGCDSAGSLYWRKPESAARGATQLSGTEFDYRVDLRLDGVHYVGRASWPQDTNEEITPGVPLTWTPALPVYRR